MKTLFRNFRYMFRRFFTASILNLFGMALSLAAFVVIMMQVNYDYNYDKGINDYDKIFLVERYDSVSNESSIYMARPAGELIAGCSPQIESAALMSNGYTSLYDVMVNENKFSMTFFCGFKDYMKVFQPEMICGSVDALDREVPDRVLIPESAARLMFGSVDILDQPIHVYTDYDETDYFVGGVYKDFPENSTMKNVAYAAFWPGSNEGNWQNYNYALYVRLTDAGAAEAVAKAGAQKLNEVANGEVNLRLVPLADLHFKSGESSKFMVYLLICASFLLVIIAAVNYMNFSLAETPMRLRSINTQKVLGATTGKLRAMLVGESVFVCLLAFVLSVGILLCLPALGLQELVSANVSLLHHTDIISWTLLLCVAIGLAAGAYPAWYATSFPPALVLKGSYGLSPQGKVLRTALISIQFTVTFILTVCIGVILLQSYFIRNSDYGYDKEVVLTGYMTNETRTQKEAVRNELMKVEGVEGVAYSLVILGTQDAYMGWGRSDEQHYMNFTCMPVDYHYLSVMGIKITEGRDFQEHDGDVYIFNEAAHKQYDWLELDKPVLTNDYPVVGFCENIKFGSFRTDSNAPMAFFIYGKDHQGWQRDNCFNIRIAKNVDKIEMMKKIQEVLEKFTPDHDFGIRFFDQILNETYKSELRFQKQMVLFSILAIVISLIGVFGLTMFESEYKKKEIGLRKIMGSTTSAILLMFNSRYIKILLCCFVVGAPLGWKFSSEWLKTFAERTPIYWWIFLAAFVLVALITLFTVTLQAWKTANENPVNSIKTE